MKLSKLIMALGLGLGVSMMNVQAEEAAAAGPGAATPTAPAMPANPNFKNDKEKVSYAIGLSIGENFKAQSIDVDVATLNKGMVAGLTGAKSLMTKEETQATMMAFQKEMISKRESMFKQQADKNAKAGTAYLAAYKSKPGVITTKSGIEYKILTAGTGAKPTDNDVVTVDYEGKLVDGTVFDTSMGKDRKPAVFPVSQVIPGWTEILKLMPVGSTWEVVIPPSLAYGERGAGGLIGPNATLIFKINLKDIKKPEGKEGSNTSVTPAAANAEQKA